MSVSFVVIPLVAANWPLISAAIVAAGVSLGYQTVAVAEELAQVSAEIDEITDTTYARSVDMVMPNAEVITDTLMRGEAFVLNKGNIHAEFRVDGHGALHVHVAGMGVSDAELEAEGNILMDRVRQQFAYAKVMEDLEARGFVVQEQGVEESGSIRIRVQRT